MPTLPPSLLKEVVDKLPEDWVMKRESVIPFLKKQGVKEEELKGAGMDEVLGEHSDNYYDFTAKGKRTKKELQGTVEHRTDYHQLVRQLSRKYANITLPRSNLNTYEITTRHIGAEHLSKDWPSHFEEKDIAWHTRSTVEDLDGHDTRLVQEIQSDVNQYARQSTTKEYQESLPFNKNWARKALEQEIITAYERGHQAIGVPIDTSALKSNPLKRAEGVEKWYNTTVKDTLKKLAKQVGGEYKEVDRLGGANRVVRPRNSAEAADILRNHPKVMNEIAKKYGHAIFDSLVEHWDDIIKTPVGLRLVTSHIRPNNEQEAIELLLRNPAVQDDIQKKYGHGTPKHLVKHWDDIIKTPIGSKLVTPYNRPDTKVDARALLEENPELLNFLKRDYYTTTNYNIRTLTDKVLEDWDNIVISDKFQKFTAGPTAKIGQIVFPEKEKMAKSIEKFKLYTASGTAIGAGALAPGEEAQAIESVSFGPEKLNEALKQGATIPEIREYLTEAGNDPVEIQSIIDSTLLEKVRAADEQGIEVDAIKSYMVENLGLGKDEVDQFIKENDIGITPTGIPGEGDMPISTSISPEPLKFTPEQVKSKYTSLHQKYSTIGKTLAGVTIEDYAKEALQDEISLASDVVTGLNKHGINARAELNTEGLFPTYDIIVDGPNGPEVLDSDIFQDIANSKYELTGAISMAGSVMRGVSVLPMHPILKGILIASGASGGAAVGRVLDIETIAESVKELDNIKAKFYVEQMIDAGVADATFGILGVATVKAGVGLAKLVGGAFDLAMRGNLNGAYKALKDHVGLDDEQIKAIVKEWEGVTGKKAPGLSSKTKAIHVLPQTVPGAEDIAGQAGQINPRVGSSIIRSINDRANNVIKSANSLTSENAAIVIRDDLEKYTDSVKSFYGGIKNHGIDSMTDSNYRFDYDQLTLEPLFQRIEKNIQNPAVLERFQSRLERIRAIGKDLIVADEPPRSFADLLDLVKVVNDFRYNSRISGHGNTEALKEIQGLLKEEIKKAATENMPNGKLWLDQWNKANVEYSKMLRLKDNVMYKALTKPGVNMDKVINIMTKDIKAIDGTFMEVLGKLPPKTRALAEGSVMKKLVDNSTIGTEGGLRAVHFPYLQKELNKIGFTSPEVREMKRAVNELGNVFRNDVNVFRSTGQISGAKFTSYLTFDPVIRLKFEIANQSFNFFRKLLPGAKGEATALISKASKVLENPSNAKAIEDLISALPNDPELVSSVKQLAIEYAKFGYPEHYPKVKVYRTVIPGKSAKTIEGKYGKGMYWTTNKGTANTRSKATGAKVMSEKINPARIASIEDINKIVGREVDLKELKDNPTIINQLKDAHFLGLSINEDILIFK